MTKFASSLGGASGEDMQDPESLMGATSKDKQNKHKFSQDSIRKVLKMILANCARYKFDLVIKKMEEYRDENPTSTMGVLQFEDDYLNLFNKLPDKEIAKYILKNVKKLGFHSNLSF